MMLSLFLAMTVATAQPQNQMVWPTSRAEWAKSADQLKAIRVAIEAIGKDKGRGKQWPEDLRADVKKYVDMSAEAALRCMLFEVEQYAASTESADTIVTAAFGSCGRISAEQGEFAKLRFESEGLKADPQILEQIRSKGRETYRELLVSELLKIRSAKAQVSR